MRPQRSRTYSRVGSPDGESSLLRMMSLHLSTIRLEGMGSPRRKSRAKQWASSQRVGGPGEPIRTPDSWSTRRRWFCLISAWMTRNVQTFIVCLNGRRFELHPSETHPVCGREQLLQVGQPFKDKLRPLMFSQLTAGLLIQQETVSSLHHSNRRPSLLLSVRKKSPVLFCHSPKSCWTKREGRK